MEKNYKSGLCFVFKCLTALFALGGFWLSCIHANHDGYRNAASRFMYYTGQSNIWLGVTMVIIVITNLISPTAYKFLKILYYFKYIFCVSITITAAVFLFLLAPFADASYHLWEYSSICTHIFAPLFALLDFFIDTPLLKITKLQQFLVIIPSSIYVFSTCILSAFKIDFGRGVYYPYFFFNMHAPTGLFGFSNVFPYFMGPFYWIMAIGLIIFILGIIYARIKNRQLKN